MDELRYPIGRFSFEAPPDHAARRGRIAEIERLPEALREAVAGLTEEQVDTPYRPEGWTVRQLVHHVADSHLHSYIRFKRALTESRPTIQPYDQDAWANLPDSLVVPVEVSVTLLVGLHRRWVALLSAMDEDDFARGLVHPERGGDVTLDRMLALYAWHGRHHTAQIAGLRSRQGW